MPSTSGGESPGGLAALLLTAYVLVGLRAARAPASAYRALLSTPIFLIAKLGTYRQMLHGLRADRWQRTERPGEAVQRARRAAAPGREQAVQAEAMAEPRGRCDIFGIPIDPVCPGEAVERILGAVATGSLLQACTINLQFLVTARRQPEVARALSQAELNVADGAPVVWLSRLLGRPLPQRVAGVDLISALAARAEVTGARLFLLGGCGGVTAAAAAELRRRHPRLRVTGTLEPPQASLDQLPDEEIILRIQEAGADILLVGFGHPKQDLWIAANRQRLPVSVSIGVGGSFDLIAGRLCRAPDWACHSGLEWLFRLAQEPRRLALRYAMCAAWLLGVLVPLAAWQRVTGATPALVSAAARGDGGGTAPRRGPSSR